MNVAGNWIAFSMVLFAIGWPAGAEAQWRKCANEGSVCKGKGIVAYGAGNRWATKVIRRQIKCANVNFGDPYPNVRKACFIASLPQYRGKNDRDNAKLITWFREKDFNQVKESGHAAWLQKPGQNPRKEYVHMPLGAVKPIGYAVIRGRVLRFSISGRSSTANCGSMRLVNRRTKTTLKVTKAGRSYTLTVRSGGKVHVVRNLRCLEGD